MTQVLEIARFAASDAYRANPTLLHPVLDIVLNRKGARAAYHGLDVETKSTIYIEVVWDAFDDHQALIDDKEDYARLFETLAPCIVTPDPLIGMHHIPFSDADYARLNAPVTEFAWVTMKPGTAGETFSTMHTTLMSSRPPAGSRGFTLRKTLEKEDLYVLLGGWDSVEAHTKVASDEEWKAASAPLMALIDATMNHAHLKEYKKTT